MLRRTKIVATLGPATESVAVIDKLIAAGVDVVRLNFSHGKAEDHIGRAAMVRERARLAGRDVGVLVDLQGPKIRTERFREGAVELIDGEIFVLDADLATDAGDVTSVGITYKSLPEDVSPGQTLLLDDGRIVLDVEAVEGRRIVTRVRGGGVLSNNKGINLQGGGLSAPALTDKDKKDILTAAELHADYLAVSFPRTAEDIHEARRLMQAAGGDAGIVAKIERAEALDDIDSIILASDVVMIARGDLAVEIGDAELVGVQKRLILRSRELNRVAITATQMMESMITSRTPTRAEVMDVANAVLDGTDAVMLSAETAAGKYPAEAVAAMARICIGAESQREIQRSSHRLDWRFERVDEAIAMASMYMANHLPVRAIVCLTESGSTTLWMSRISSGIPIFALTRHEATRRRVTMYRGVYPVDYDVVHDHPNEVVEHCLEELKRLEAVKDGDRVIVTKGDFNGIPGGTNSIKIVNVGEVSTPANP